MNEHAKTKSLVREYYGKVLATSDDLKTSACCTPGALPPGLSDALSNVHDEVRAKYYGCGFVAPEHLEGARVLDLGCGAGQDVYVLAQMVGAKGRVVGVDMTAEQLDVARAHVDWHKNKFGYCCSNVQFLEGYIEELDKLGLEPASFDVIVSNCVINLSPDKAAVLAGARSLLKPGGEIYFSDVYADRRLPDSVKQDPVLLGECLGGALYWGDFLEVSRAAGFGDARLVTARPLTVDDPVLAAKCGAARFYSATYRLFNIEALEPRCEDYGQAVIYKGGIPGHEDVFVLDTHHRIEKGKVFPVCGNTYRMLMESRFAAFFDGIGDFSTHYGIFPGCGTQMPLEVPGARVEKVAVVSQPGDGGKCC
ncbi:MAG: methyltransferase domain-containing protein [Hyphomicrobiaceae bacterium]|nr:methyltransferase domain-containing protein [Hyphomicrobiaceae bacterium]